MTIPVLTIAKRSTIFLYDHLRTVEDNVNALHDAPPDAGAFYEAIVAGGRRIYGGYQTDYLGEPDERLAEHIIVFHLRGLLMLDDVLVTRMYEKASPELRKHVINFIGRSLWEHSVPEPIRNRMHAFWSWRLAACATADDSTELKAFGAWFAATHEDSAWALPRLIEALRIQPDIDLEFMVLKRLAELVSDMPVLAAEALRLLVTGTTELWTLGVENENVARISVYAALLSLATCVVFVPRIRKMPADINWRSEWRAMSRSVLNGDEVAAPG